MGVVSEAAGTHDRKDMGPTGKLFWDTRNKGGRRRSLRCCLWVHNIEKEKYIFFLSLDRWGSSLKLGNRHRLAVSIFCLQLSYLFQRWLNLLVSWNSMIFFFPLLQAVKLVTELCLEYKIYDLKLWNGLLQKLLGFNMVSKTQCPRLRYILKILRSTS